MLRKLVRDRPHQKYYLRDGSQVIGCSTVAGLAESKEGLMSWCHKQGLAGKDYRAERDVAADSGVVAHGLSEAYLVGDTLDLSDFTEEAQKLGQAAFEKFREWWEGGRYTFLYSELQLTSEAHRFGGTLDILARNPEKDKCLIDLKVTRSLRTSHGIQTGGGYLILENENRPGEPIDKVCILRLPKDGTDVEPKWLPPETFAYYQKAFLANLSSFYARRALDKVCPMAYIPKWKRK